MVRRSMTSPPRTAREAERHVNLRTLVIASVASATAAVVTSRLWIAGTWIAAAVTPVLVTLLSELLRRPTERIARGLTTEREALPDPEAPARRVAERLRGVDELVPDPEVRVYRSRPAPARKRQIAYRVVLATAALGFAIGAAALTVPELIAGNSFGDSGRRTTLGGGSSGGKSSSKTPTKAVPSVTDTQSRTTQTQTETTTTTQTQTETVAPAPQGEPTDTTSTTQTTP
jgi:hypothetical protein